jgi:hypothetical protein
VIEKLKLEICGFPSLLQKAGTQQGWETKDHNLLHSEAVGAALVEELVG